ncbi:CBS domain-containing protein [Falsiroseomonas oryziterrae]|uniref:CBS domain-containing protein n=1 Tax=Falsiroseomonas oryziterrae TaxID=2911368 RepID=UPI001F2DD1B7|nr:CBS domain-containing protein [Roseomonas sp. NPKOSM-4]
MTIATILRRKGNSVVSVGAQDEVGAIARILSEKRIGAVLVQDAGGDVLGIVSERDIVRCIAAHGCDAVTMPAARLMTRALHTVTPRTHITEALELMTDRRVRHLPVLEEDGRLAGMISIGDLVKARIDEALHEAEELRHYVETAG